MRLPEGFGRTSRICFVEGSVTDRFGVCSLAFSLRLQPVRPKRSESPFSRTLLLHDAQIVTIERAQQSFLIRERPRRISARFQTELRELVDVPILAIGHIPEPGDVARIEIPA